MVDEVAMACLDLQLGVPQVYDRYGAFGRDPTGKMILMEFHATRNQRPERPGRARPDYLSPIVDAARSRGVPQSYLEQLQDWATPA